MVKLDFDIPMIEAGHGDLWEALHQESCLMVWEISLDAIQYHIWVIFSSTRKKKLLSFAHLSLEIFPPFINVSNFLL